MTNGRVVGSTPYPAAEAGISSAKYWPERDLSTNPDSTSELKLRGGDRARVREALDLADNELKAQNSWEESIRTMGVFAPVTVAVLAIETDDVATKTILSAVDGSSRVASCHRVLGLASSELVYGPLAEARTARGRLQQLMALLSLPQQDVPVEQLELLRGATIPATIVIGFRPDRNAGTDFVSALDEYVALLHLETARPWTPPARENKIADAVIDELKSANVIDASTASWYAGMLSPAAAVDAGLAREPDRRAAEILKAMSAAASSEAGRAISAGVRRLSLNKRAGRTVKAQIAASLGMRAVVTPTPNKQRVATTLLERLFCLERFWRLNYWDVTDRDPDDLLDEALDEDARRVFGAATLELGALAAYWLAVTGVLGSEEAGSDIASGRERRESDKREPRRVLDAMLETEYGIRTLHRVVVDGRAGRIPQRIDEDGEITVNANGEPLGPMTNFWLRGTFRPEPAATNPVAYLAPTPMQALNAAIASLRASVDVVEEAIVRIEAVRGDDEGVLVDTEGVDILVARDIRRKLDDIKDHVIGYQLAWKRRHPKPSETDPELGDGTEDQL